MWHLWEYLLLVRFFRLLERQILEENRGTAGFEEHNSYRVFLDVFGSPFF